MNPHADHQRADRPRTGDILIAKDANSGYTLSVAPGEPQLRHPTYELALSTAQAWALRQGVAVWFTQDGEKFVKLESNQGTRGQTRSADS